MTWNGKLGFETQPSTPINITIPDLVYANAFDSNDGAGLDGPQGIMGIQATLPEENYGLFEIFDAAAGLERPADEESMRHVDVVAVHGLMGHWENTWNVGNSHSDPMFLRDRIPADLSRINVRARVFSYGYDSAVFSRSVVTIDQAADMLLGRLLGKRRTSEEKNRPIVFIAHSLGGLVVKQAMIQAWTRNEYYKDLLESVKGYVPYLSLGFRGNSKFLESLSSKSADWMRISRDFVHRATSLQIRTFYETDRLGNVIVVDESSATMNLPNELALPLAGSNHVTICKFSASENQRYEPVKDALEDLVRAGLEITQRASNMPLTSVMPLTSDMPLRTDTFCGREKELQKMAEALHPAKPRQTDGTDPANPRPNGLILYGIGGSGKTQLALRYIQKYGSLYKAIVWINASDAQILETSFAEAAGLLSGWPDNTAPRSSTTIPQKLVVSKLLDPRSSPWLLIMDSVDDLNQHDFRACIPSCAHGSVIFTSTRANASDVFHLSHPHLEIDRLDENSGCQLLQKIVGDVPIPETDWTAKIVKELHGIPLAIEHAGKMMRNLNIWSKPWVLLKRFKSPYRVSQIGLVVATLNNDDQTTHSFSILQQTHTLDRTFLAPLRQCVALVRRKVPADEILPPHGRYCRQYAELVADLSWVDLSCGLLAEGERDFTDAIEYRRAKAEAEWPNSQADLMLLEGLAVIRFRSGDFDSCIDVLKSALALAETLYQPFDPEPVAIVSYLKEVSETRERLQQDHKSVVLAGSSTITATAKPSGKGFWDGTFIPPNYGEQQIVPDKHHIEGGIDFDADLRGAACHGYIEEVKLLLSIEGINPNSQDERGMTALSWAVYKRHETIVQLLLGIDQINVNVRDPKGRTPLHVYSSAGNSKIVQALLQRGADVNESGDHGTALQTASAKGHDKIVYMLLKSGADVNKRDWKQDSPLQIACGQGYSRIVQMLLDHNADVYVRGEDQHNAIETASFNDHGKIVQMLLEYNADFNIQGELYGSALYMASLGGHDNIVHMLLDHHTVVNAQNACYNKARFAASAMNHDKIVQMLLHRKSRLTIETIFYIYANKVPPLVPSLSLYIQKDMIAKRDVACNKTLLHWAADRGDQPATERCLDLGAKIDDTDGYGMTALHFAAEKGHLNVLKTLVLANADRTILDDYGRTALDCAGAGERQATYGKYLEVYMERAVGNLANQHPASDLMGRTYANSFLVSSDVTHAVNPTSNPYTSPTTHLTGSSDQATKSSRIDQVRMTAVRVIQIQQ
ncbi:hypothetical protein KCU73_g3113, partial [Aureobasidium melanogenum]